MIKTESLESSWSIRGLGQALEQKRISSLEATRCFLDRIAGSAHLNAFITVLEEQALESAGASDARRAKNESIGPLDGIPLAVKDLFGIRGVPTTMGCTYYESDIAERDAFVISLLRRAGAVIIGKTNTSQFAMGPTGELSSYGPCRNPQNTALVAGGSSSGSAAAVAADLCCAALGTDTGGSIRLPAALCGLVGLKPTMSLISTRGVAPLSVSLDTVGPLTRNIWDNAVLLNHLTVYDALDWRNAPLQAQDYTARLEDGIADGKITLAVNAFEDIDDTLSSALDHALATLKKTAGLCREAVLPDLGEFQAAHRKLLVMGGHQAQLRLIQADAPDILPDVLARLKTGAGLSSDVYIACERLKEQFIDLFDTAFGDAEVLITPVSPLPPVPVGTKDILLNGRSVPVTPTYLRLTWMANLSGFPSLSLPVGISRTGLPVGLMMTAKPYDEANLYRYARALERELS
ncbi:MAG: amidase [Desulfovibrio sp.]|jgi:aspartyl-tRNA(Asn)/glutamyl-tRNA(Gln) amidotransferase subunit A|nr:amidase [Desulfovibrio sp.]